MTLKKILFLVIMFATFSNAQNVKIKSDVDSVSYAIGYSIGQNFKAQGLDINYEILIKAIKDALDGKQPVISEEVMTQTIVSYQDKKRKEQEAKLKKIGSKNLKEGEAFLERNKRMPGIQTTQSGLQYRVINYGEGESPKKTDKVKVHYKGTLIDGREFDNSYKRGEPIEFEVIGVIPGWTEALQLMKVGDKWELFIPSNLAYGNRNRSELIGPNSTLIFEVELLEVVNQN